jgi:hypothetical protein
LTYEAAADPSRWNDFLRLFSEAIHAPSVVFLIHSKTHPKADASGALGVDPAWVKSYEEYFVTINPWQKGDPFARGVVALGEQILNDGQLVRTEFYNDFLRPQDWFYSCGVLIAQDQLTASSTAGLVLQLRRVDCAGPIDGIRDQRDPLEAGRKLYCGGGGTVRVSGTAPSVRGPHSQSHRRT